ncbi:MAG: EVE domain-containing protein, partial [Gammaproteobacteria bacterium]|nr:EVE domain-containing protein [Gammaproteobacteria bacterium]
RAHRELAGMLILRRGNRLSVTPVSAPEWTFIMDKLVAA